MGYLIINKDKEGGDLRRNMRRSMRGGYHHDGEMPMMRDDREWEHGYRMGYKHGWDDSEDEMEEEHYRRARDSRGRYV